MKSNFSFPCIFTYEEKGINVTFPDLPGCITFGVTEEDAFKNAKEALEGFLYFMEKDNDAIPAPSKINTLVLKKNEVITQIFIWMIPVRDEMQNKHIKKTLTIPKWLNDVGIKNKINFSHLLQVAIKQYLDI